MLLRMRLSLCLIALSYSANVTRAADSDAQVRGLTTHDRYQKVSIRLPCDNREPPSDDEVLRALVEIDSGTSAVASIRKDLGDDAFTIEKELMADYIDPPRVLPLVGLAQVQHRRWKCTVSVPGSKFKSDDVAVKDSKLVQEVIYLDHTNLIAVNYREPETPASSADVKSSASGSLVEDKKANTQAKSVQDQFDDGHNQRRPLRRLRGLFRR
jgi:hypothetical protein